MRCPYIIIFIIGIVVLSAGAFFQSVASEDIQSATPSEESPLLGHVKPHFLTTSSYSSNDKISSAASAFAADNGSGSDSDDNIDDIQRQLIEEFLIRTTETGTPSPPRRASPKSIDITDAEEEELVSQHVTSSSKLADVVSTIPHIEDNLVIEPSSSKDDDILSSSSSSPFSTHFTSGQFESTSELIVHKTESDYAETSEISSSSSVSTAETTLPFTAASSSPRSVEVRTTERDSWTVSETVEQTDVQHVSSSSSAEIMSTTRTHDVISDATGDYVTDTSLFPLTSTTVSLPESETESTSVGGEKIEDDVATTTTLTDFDSNVTSIDGTSSTMSELDLLSIFDEVNISSSEESLFVETTQTIQDSTATESTELSIMKNVKSYDKLTEVEFFNSVTVVFQKPSGSKDVLYFNQDIFKKTVVCFISVYESEGWPEDISNTTACDFMGKNGEQYDFPLLKPNDLVIVYPSPKESEEEEIVSFFVKNSTAKVSGKIVSRNRTLTALGQHKESLSKQMNMEVVDIYGRIPVSLLITPSSEPLHVRHTLLLLILLAVASFCIIIIIAGLICLKCRSQGALQPERDHHDKAHLQGDIAKSEMGAHLNSDEDIRKDEAQRIWKNGNGVFGTENGNGSGSTVIPITDNNDSWVVPYNQLTADEKAVPETLDTKL